MSLAENLLNSLDETAYENMRIVGSGEEEHIIVGQDRSITVPNALKTIAVEGDKDVETATIDCVRYWDGHDLSTFAIYLNYILPNGDEGTYIPKGISKAEDTFSFDWLVGSEFTYAQGKMTFWIVAKLTDDSGTLIKQWSSFQNSDCTIAQGGDKIYVPEKQTDQDVISQAISISRASAEAAEKAATDAREAAEDEVTRLVGELGVVQAPGKSPTSVVSQAVTTALYNRNSKRITNLEQGVAEQFETDASVAYVKDVPANALPYAEIKKIGGMTYKDGNTLKSAKVTEVKIVGVNLLDSLKISKTNINGISIEYLKDEGCFLINGTATQTGMRSTTKVNISIKKHTVYRITNSYVSGTITRPSGTGYALTYIGYNNPNTTNENWLSCDLNMRDSRYAGNSSDATTLTGFWFYIDAGVSFNNYKVRVMIYEGDALLPYTPYVEHTLPIPEEVRPANGINENVYDFIEWAEDGSVKSHKMVEKVVFDGSADEAWNFKSGRDYAYAPVTALGTARLPIFANKQGIDAVWLNYGHPKNIQYGHGGTPLPHFASIEEFRAWLSQNPLEIVYELATPIVTDISYLITADNLIGVEGGGTLTFENEYGYAVPSEVEYQVEV